MESINLKSVEKKIWLATFQDGIWDIYWGILLIGFGISPALENLGVIKPLNFVFFPILAFLLLILGKKFITIPRTGMIKFGENRKSDFKKLFVFGLLIFIFTVILFFLLKQNALRTESNNSLSNITAPILYAIIFICSISAIAYFLEYQRLHFYAFLFGISIPLAEILYFLVGEPWDALIAFSVTSMPILITGIFLFNKFIKTYHPLNQEEKNA